MRAEREDLQRGTHQTGVASYLIGPPGPGPGRPLPPLSFGPLHPCCPPGAAGEFDGLLLPSGVGQGLVAYAVLVPRRSGTATRSGKARFSSRIRQLPLVV